MGNLVLGAGSRQLYEHASKTRNKLVNEFDNVFTNECDVMLSPTSCNIAPLIEDIVNGNKKNTNDDIEDPTLEYIDDIFTIPASLVGIPSFAIPIYNDNKEEEGNLKLAAFLSRGTATAARQNEAAKFVRDIRLRSLYAVEVP